MSLVVQIGRQISKIRKTKQMTQEDLSNKAGISNITLSYIENGRRSPSLYTLELIAEALEVQLSVEFIETASNHIDADSFKDLFS